MSDPILSAIAEHRAAWDAFQVAADGRASEDANIRMLESMDALLATSCATRPGAWALLDHLNWWLAEEAAYADDYRPAYGHAKGRAEELVMLLEGATGSPVAPDPVHTAIRAAMEADDALTVICDSLDETDEPAMRRHNTASDRAGAMRRALAQTTPTTLVGIRALARHYELYEEYPEGFKHLATALEGYGPTSPLPIGQGALCPVARRVGGASPPAGTLDCARVPA